MDGNPKQLIAQRIKDATNILVTVNRNPSVDQLAAALALTLMLNKLDKHATAVFSGEVPHAIDFLEPGKTFESSVSSLRDFIIALDKEKADRLRYKVEDGVVRIFITPYRTTITQNDLQFSEGDFNVELIIALGVDVKEDLDRAIETHGRILHDAVVLTINADDDKNTLGEVDWSDKSASSLSEMLMSLSESLKGGLLDEQIANALLTGIVSATNRFSNERTSPKVMTMSAQLMAAGANQQLITAQLQDAGHVSAPATAPVEPPKNKDDTTSLTEGDSAKLVEHPREDKKADGEMIVEHDKPDALTVANKLAQQHEAMQQQFEQALPSPVAAPSVGDLQNDIAAASQAIDTASQDLPPSAREPQKSPYLETPPASESQPDDEAPRSSDWRDKMTSPPSMGGTLNATVSQAEEARIAEARSETNRTILEHGALGQQPEPMTGIDMSYEETPASSYLNGAKAKTLTPLSEPPRTSDFSGMTLSEIEAKERGTEGPFVRPMPDPLSPSVSQPPVVEQPMAPPLNPVDDARAAVDAAFGGTPMSTPTQPGYVPAAVDPMQPPVAADPAQATVGQPLSTPLPPLPDFSTLPPLPPQPGDIPQTPFPGASQTPPQEPQQPSAPNPGQFQIPGQ